MPRAAFLAAAWLAGAAGAAAEAPRRVRLNNGVEMPLVSLGTWKYNDSSAEANVDLALGLGFTGLDAAFNYFDQAGVGRALKRFNRSAVFLTTKTTPCIHPQAPPAYNITDVQQCKEQTRRDVEADFSQLGVDYIDLLLLHGANHHGAGSCGELACRLNSAQWEVYEEFYKSGKIRAIGVSNFCPSCITCLLDRRGVVPAVNQVKFHAGMGEDPQNVMTFSAAHGIVPMAYSPMGSGEIFTDPLLLRVGATHNKTAAQVALRWITAKGYPLATRSASASHLQEDLDLFSWELGHDEAASIDALRVGSDIPSWACSDPAVSATRPIFL